MVFRTLMVSGLRQSHLVPLSTAFVFMAKKLRQIGTNHVRLDSLKSLFPPFFSEISVQKAFTPELIDEVI